MTQPTRREFLGRTAAGTAGLAGILSSGVPPARGQQREISYLCWNNFAPAWTRSSPRSDRASPRTRASRSRSTTSPRRSRQKYASEVQTQTGHDLVEMRMHFPWLYEPQLVDVSDVAIELEKKHGKSSPRRETAKVKGVWRAVPQYHRFFVCTYREDLFKKAEPQGSRHLGGSLHARQRAEEDGPPGGDPHRQNYDSISTAGPVLWSFGGMEVDKDGQTVRINSPATEQMIEWYKKMYPRLHGARSAVLDRRQQQRVDAAGKAGWIHNPVSAYVVARNGRCRRPTCINHQRSLAGPKAATRPTCPATWDLEVLEERRAGERVDPLSAGQARSLRRVDHVGRRVQPAQLREAVDHPVLKTDPKYAALRAPGVQYHLYGWPAPGTDKVQRITNEYILPNMIAKAVTGTSTKEAGAWAEKEMKRILGGYPWPSVRPPPPDCPPPAPRVRELFDRERFLGPAFVTPALLLIRSSSPTRSAWHSTSRCRMPSSGARATSWASETSSPCGRPTPSARRSRTPSSSPVPQWG